MARTKEYNKDQALQDAMILFWTQGYSATSVQQLLDIMGLSRSSMYAEFGNKRDLFLEALSRYNNSIDQLIDGISKAVDPADAVKEFYRIGFTQQPDDLRHKGCFMVNTIVELRHVDDELSSIAANSFNQIEEAFTKCFQKCIVNGTLRHDCKPEALAAFFMTLFKGMRVTGSQGVSENYLDSVIEPSLVVFQKTL